MRLLITIILLSVSFLSVADDLVFLNDPADTNKQYPFSKATRVANLLFLSGELGVDPKTGKLVKGGIVPETKQLMKNIAATLKKYNSSLNRVAKCTVFLADIKDWPKFNDIYRSFFTNNYPARSAMAVSGLGLGAQLEVECIAVVND